MMKKRSAAFGICALVLAAGLAFLPRSAESDEVVAATGDIINLETGKGALLRLDRTPATVFIADPRVADLQVKSPRLLYLLGKKPGETTLFAVDGSDRVVLNRRVRVQHNVSRLSESIQQMIPDSQIKVQAIDGMVVLGGYAASAADAENARQLAKSLVKSDKNLVNQIQITEPNQVNLRVRIAEVSRTVMKQFGINWDNAFRAGEFFWGLSVGTPALIPEDGVIPLFSNNKVFQTRNNGTNSLFGSFANNNVDVNGVVDALEDEGLVTILAEPNLTALSGEPATFLAGGEFPVLVPDDGSVTVEFKQFGVSLAFTPTLISRNRVSLKVNPEVSQLSTAGQTSFNGFVVPALTTRRAETTVELGSGQSFAIAGLIQNNITESLAKYPGLSDIPVLGALFNSNSFQRAETELVIIVTPYIVQPIAPGRVASPTDGLIAPNDVDRILHGRTFRTSMQRRRRNLNSQGIQGLEGPAGFVLK